MWPKPNKQASKKTKKGRHMTGMQTSKIAGTFTPDVRSNVRHRLHMLKKREKEIERERGGERSRERERRVNN